MKIINKETDAILEASDAGSIRSAHFNRKRSNWRLPGRPILEASIPTC